MPTVTGRCAARKSAEPSALTARRSDCSSPNNRKGAAHAALPARLALLQPLLLLLLVMLLPLLLRPALQPAPPARTQMLGTLLLLPGWCLHRPRPQGWGHRHLPALPQAAAAASTAAPSQCAAAPAKQSLGQTPPARCMRRVIGCTGGRGTAACVNGVRSAVPCPPHVPLPCSRAPSLPPPPPQSPGPEPPIEPRLRVYQPPPRPSGPSVPPAMVHATARPALSRLRP